MTKIPSNNLTPNEWADSLQHLGEILSEKAQNVAATKTEAGTKAGTLLYVLGAVAEGLGETIRVMDDKDS